MSSAIDPSTGSMIAVARTAPARRQLSKVPFVELYNRRLQGVVSSKSDYRRVYVAFIAAGTTDFYCSTNNNRPCGGLRGGTCKHIDAMIANAVSQYGGERVARYLGLDVDNETVNNYWIARRISGAKTKQPAGDVFSRFLNYLRYVRMPYIDEPVPEMDWFLTG